MLSYLVLKYATAFSGQQQSQFYIEDDDDCEEQEELLFCKNNVCVPDTKSGQKETPGYFILKCRTRLSGRKRLIVSWTPNSHLLDKHETQPTTIERQQLQKVFNVDLSEMKSLTLFYDDDKHTSGQFVVGNYENHYKVFNFPVGGLEKITEILESWEWCVSQKVNDDDEKRKRCFLVTLKTPVNKDCYVEEGRYNPMTYDVWKTLFNNKGQIEDVANFRRAVFFGGLSPEVRKEAWKFLLFYYTFDSTHQERKQLKDQKEIEYLQIHRQRLSMSEKEQQQFWKAVQCTVDKDVPRTDRSHPYFAGNDNPNTEVMRNILLNYAVHNPLVGYNQGMSDLLAPVLAVIQDEVDAFWCFAGLMEASVFVTSPKDDIMDRQLRYLRELTRMLDPKFYAHLLIKDEGLDMLFCHRWLLLCFKREFFNAEVLLMWEACWSRYQTEYFHIFLCVAMVQEYGHEVIDRDMQVDDMLQYFTDLALKMDGSLVLRKARQLLLKFRQLPYIPCCVRGLLSGPGVWDSAPLPVIECLCRGKCRYEEEMNENVDYPGTTSKEDEREKYQDEIPEKCLTKHVETETKRLDEEEKEKQVPMNTVEENKRNADEIVYKEEKSEKTSEIISEHKVDQNDVQAENEERTERGREELEEEEYNNSKENSTAIAHDDERENTAASGNHDHEQDEIEGLAGSAKTSLNGEQDNKSDTTIEKTAS